MKNIDVKGKTRKKRGRYGVTQSIIVEVFGSDASYRDGLENRSEPEARRAFKGHWGSPSAS